MDPESNRQTIKVTERDLKEETLTCIDLDRNIWVKLGFPKISDTGFSPSKEDFREMENLKGPPYVFKADSIILTDIKHPEGVELKDVWTIYMHGGRKEGGNWMFTDLQKGYPVVETVRAVNKYLEQKGEPPVEVVMSCNKTIPPGVPSIVKIGDFNDNENIVFAVEEKVYLRYSTMSEDGKIHFNAKADEFWGLDKLETSKHVKIL